MVQRYNSLAATQEAESILLAVKRAEIIEFLRMRKEYLDSSIFTAMIKDVGVFRIFDEISKESILTGVNELKTILKNFGTPQSYHDLARVAFPNYISSTSTSDNNNNIHITVTLAPIDRGLITAKDQAIVTQNNKWLAATTKQIQQNRNDYNYLVNRLSAADITVTVTYN